jgi:AcrR family transcriptional regulator
LTVRAVARNANMSERTVFRYFCSREELLDAVADEVRLRLDLPPPPTSLEELYAAPEALFRAFEARVNLTKAALHSEIFTRMRQTQAKDRWIAVARIIDELAPDRSRNERRIAAANIRYYLSATTWHYYRFYFEFDLKESTRCARAAIGAAIEALKNNPGRENPARA